MEMVAIFSMGMIAGMVGTVIVVGLVFNNDHDEHIASLIASLDDIAEHARDVGNIGTYRRFSSAARVIRQHMGIEA